MSEAAAPIGAGLTPQKAKKTGAPDTLVRVGKYTVTRTVSLFITVVIGVYLTILIANMGGHVDKIRSNQIREQVGAMSMAPEIRALPAEERNAWMAEMVRVEEERLGLDQPFIIRSFRFLAAPSRSTWGGPST
jgi:peptide/nickel transport system permease protein